MKRTLFVIISVMPLMARADDILPKQPDFNRYQTMLDRSFAIETEDVSTASCGCPTDLFIMNVADSGADCVATLGCAADKHFKKYFRIK